MLLQIGMHHMPISQSRAVTYHLTKWKPRFCVMLRVRWNRPMGIRTSGRHKSDQIGPACAEKQDCTEGDLGTVKIEPLELVGSRDVRIAGATW